MHYQGRLKKLSDGLLHETRQNPFYDELKENGYKNKKSQIVCRVCGTATHAVAALPKTRACLGVHTLRTL